MFQEIFKLIRFAFLSIFLLITSSGIAQNTGTSIGLRTGSPTGISMKHFISDQDALEAVVAFRWRGIQATGLFQRHAMAFDVEQLSWYYGFGAHIGFFDAYKNHPYFDDKDYNNSYVIIGVDGLIGLEYDIREIPFTVSLDWKPEVNIIGYTGTWIGAGGISVRYYW